MLPAKNPIISDADNAIDRFIFCLPWPTQSRSQSTNSMIAGEVWRYAKMARLLGYGFQLRVTPINGHRQTAPACPVGATSGLSRRKKVVED
jgi:hypothetical protein